LAQYAGTEYLESKGNKKMKNPIKTNGIAWSTLAVVMMFSTTTHAGDKLTSKELNSLLVGNFMKIVYIYQGEGIQMWEYYQKDGTVAGSTDKWGDYSATYEINDKNQICLNYSSKDYNGCYSYERVGDNQYKLVDLTWPENTTLDVTIVPGQWSNLAAN